MQASLKRNLNELNSYQKRVEILVGARLKDIKMISSAIAVQNKLRKKSGRWSGAEEIKKWRKRE